jgi:hypothetical protein
MALREAFKPLRPDLDGFLFAAVGAEQNGVPLSMLSALTRLGLDPWDEAARLSSLGKREAVEQLARLIAEVPGICRPLAEAREIACNLVLQLPEHERRLPVAPPIRLRQFRLREFRLWPRGQIKLQFLMFCLVAVAAALISALLHGGLPFGIGFP